MSIDFKVNFKQPIIGLLPIFGLGEKLYDVIHGELESSLDLHDLYDRAFLLTNDKEGTRCGNLIKSVEVKIASVKYTVYQRLVSELVHYVNIMRVGVCNSLEHGNLCDVILLSVDFDARLSASELSPNKERNAEADSRRVHVIEPAVQFKHSCDSLLLSKECYAEVNSLKMIY